MEIQIVPLDKISFTKLTLCFNAAFSDYIVKFTISEDALRERWYSAGVDYKYSYGAVVNGILAGFVVHGIGELDGVPTAYNAGTGVVPDFRGLKITRKIYEHALPLLKAKGIRQSVLEVIRENEAAIHIYQSVGFKFVRKLCCFGGKYNLGDPADWSEELELRPLNEDWKKLRNFWDFQPDWEAKPMAIQYSEEELLQLGLYENERLCGYTAFHPDSGKIRQFAVNKQNRRKGVGRILFSQMAEICPELRINNVDENATGTISFLLAMGLKNVVNQYEMKMELV